MKKILLITTGGTIASKYDETLGGDVPATDSINPQSLGLFDVEIQTYPLCNIDSSQMNLNIMLQIASYANQNASKFDGIVITHGTDTLEDTSFFLSHTYSGQIPLVLTASMRSADSVGADGPVNLKDAIVTALSSNTIAGVYVVINGQIFDAEEIHKSSTTNVATFIASWSGPLGYVDDENVFFKHALRSKTLFNVPQSVKPVHLIKCQVSVGSEYIDFAISQCVKGIVLEGFGRGNIPSDMISGIDRAIAANIPVVITSRCGAHRVLDIYACPGSASDCVKHGAILGGDLSAEKARILLALYLSNIETIDMDKLQGLF